MDIVEACVFCGGPKEEDRQSARSCRACSHRRGPAKRRAVPAFEPDPPAPPMTEERRERTSVWLRALRASVARLTRDDPYRDCPPRSSPDFPVWLRERARARETAGPVLNPPVPTRGEMAEVVPLRRPGGASPAS